MMASGERRVGKGRLSLTGMFSLEPWTIGRLVYAHGVDPPERVYAFDNAGVRQPIGGSPQAFQTGESYLGSPLINYQHPHDLVMNAGATYRLDAGPLRYTIGADLVGSPAPGPTPFMHRDSARNNPSAPLTHHNMDSTHITPGVLRSGVEAGPMLRLGIGADVTLHHTSQDLVEYYGSAKLYHAFLRWRPGAAAPVHIH